MVIFFNKYIIPNNYSTSNCQTFTKYSNDTFIKLHEKKKKKKKDHIFLPILSKKLKLLQHRDQSQCVILYIHTSQAAQAQVKYLLGALICIYSVHYLKLENIKL